MMLTIIIFTLIGGMSFGADSLTPPYNSFTGGQVTQHMEGRADFPKYMESQRITQNFLPLTEGPIRKRPGTTLGGTWEAIPAAYPREYPTLHELDASEIPSKPSEPADTALSTPISITNKAGVQAISGSGHYSIDADNIDLSGAWTPIVGFSGVLEGNGNTLINLTINTTATDNVGLFSTLNTNAEIRNLNLSNFTIAGDDSVGGLVGYINTQDDIKISDVTIAASAITGDNDVGGLAGRVYNSDGFNMWRCSATTTNVGPIAGQGGNTMGGLIGLYYHGTGEGTNPTNIVDCYATGGIVTGWNEVGGFVGHISFFADSPTPTTMEEVHSCYSTNTVKVEDSSLSGSPDIFGGFAGSIYSGRITSCYSTGDVIWDNDTGESRWDYVGGFIGIHYGGNGAPTDVTKITNCYANGDITITSLYLTQPNFIGGFMGKSDVDSTRFLRCYATGDINITPAQSPFTITSTGIGGFAGAYRGNASPGGDYGELRRCFTWTNISIDAYDIQGDGTYIGGFVGQSNNYHPTNIDCYTWSNIDLNGEVLTADYGGGYLGVNDSTASDVFTLDNVYCAQPIHSTGTFTPSQTVTVTTTPQAVPDLDTGNLRPFQGGLGPSKTGFDATAATNCFFDSETAGSAVDTSAATAYNTLNMKTKSNFEAATWSFSTEYGVKGDPNDIWTMPSDAETSSTGGAPDAARLIPFVFNTDDSYILAFDAESLGFLRTNSGVSGRIQE
jgi:hypothetical protein